MGRRPARGAGQTIDGPSLRRSVAEFQFGAAEIEQLATAAAARHRRVMRVRPDRHPPADAGPPVAFYPRAVEVNPAAPAASQRIAYAAGDYYIQDAGSLLALALAGAGTDALAGQTVCDLCAAPGGKASALLESIGDGWVVANEPIGSRIAPLAVNLARTGRDRYVITSADPDALAVCMGGRFDLVLVDAPCSGQTMVGRGKQAKSSAAEAMIAVNVARQRRILAAAVRLLRPGGRLLYSTCTFAVAENEDQVRWLCQETDLVAQPVAGLDEHASDLHPGCYRTWPHRHGCDGSFAASMRLPGDAPSPSVDFASPMPLDRDAAAAMTQFYGEIRPAHLAQRGWLVEGWSTPLPGWIQAIHGGPEWLHRSGKTWRPSHAAALRLSPGQRPGVAVDDADAATYLTGQSIPCDVQGWAVVTHDDRPLGWIKGDGRVGKNHLPPHARMRVDKGSPIISRCKTG